MHTTRHLLLIWSVACYVSLSSAFISSSWLVPHTMNPPGEHRLVPPYRHTHDRLIRMSMHNTEENSESVENTLNKQLTPDKVAEMVEVSFVNACLQLAKGYIDVLKLFIVAVKAGYELDLAHADLTARVDAFPHQSAGRPLMEEEIRLRNTWIQVIYLVLDHVGHQQIQGDSTVEVNEHIQTTYAPVLSDMAEARVAGKTFQVEEALQTYKDYLPTFDDLTEKAIVSQSLRVIWLTYTVLDEEQQCLEGKSGLKAQPPIPGAFQ